MNDNTFDVNEYDSYCARTDKIFNCCYILKKNKSNPILILNKCWDTNDKIFN